MLIFALDDEEKMLEQLHMAIREAEPEAGIRDFRRAKKALEAIAEEGLRPDIVFSDIEMPGMNGLGFALELKKLAPEVKLVFVTAYSEYAMDAYQCHVKGYLLKPVDAEGIRGELRELELSKTEPEDERLRVRCFGHFEVFYKGNPVVFSRSKAKELLAYLIDREGGVCTASEIISALWEENEDESAGKNRLRTVLNNLRATLKELGLEDLLIRERRQLAIRPELLNCDYYNMLKGDMAALNSYHGEYMIQYSWAELTGARLQMK